VQILLACRNFRVPLRDSKIEDSAERRHVDGGKVGREEQEHLAKPAKLRNPKESAITQKEEGREVKPQGVAGKGNLLPPELGESGKECQKRDQTKGAQLVLGRESGLDNLTKWED